MNAAHTENERIEAALRHVPANNRDLWLKILMALKSEYGEAGRDLAETWSKTDPSFNAQAFRDVWKGLKPDGGVNIGTLFHVAKQHGYRDDKPHVMPTAEQIERIEKARGHQTAAKLAAVIWNKGKPVQVQDEHPYTLRKGVQAIPALGELQADELKALAGYVVKSSGEPLSGRILMVRIKVQGKLASLEFIDESGRKSALKGGAKAGGYAPLQATPEGKGEGLTMLIGEGVASCMTAKQATGHPAFAALSSSNLLSVAKQLRTDYPAAAFVILGELLKSSGELDPHSIQAAEAIGARLAVPDFGKERHQEQTDINDFSAKFGAQAVQELIDEAIKTQRAVSVAISPKPDAWPEPQPLHAKIEPLEYPLEALPEHVLAAVEEVRAFVQAPTAMVATCALSALSLAIQALIDVQRASKLSGPVGLFSLVIAESGERKSRCDGDFTA